MFLHSSKSESSYIYLLTGGHSKGKLLWNDHNTSIILAHSTTAGFWASNVFSSCTSGATIEIAQFLYGFLSKVHLLQIQMETSFKSVNKSASIKRTLNAAFDAESKRELSNICSLCWF